MPRRPQDPRRGPKSVSDIVRRNAEGRCDTGAPASQRAAERAEVPHERGALSTRVGKGTGGERNPAWDDARSAATSDNSGRRLAGRAAPTARTVARRPGRMLTIATVHVSRCHRQQARWKRPTRCLGTSNTNAEALAGRDRNATAARGLRQRQGVEDVTADEFLSAESELRGS